MSTVLVTGVTGFIGLHCVHQLIQAGHHVHGTLRSKSREHEVRESLRRANLADGNLVLFECDLLGDSGWNDAVRGCDYILHVASPFIAGIPDHEDDLIKPAVAGTKKVLELAAQVESVKKVVLTSSFAAVGDTFDGTTVFDESHWSNLDNPNISAYNKSKTLAEKAAWGFMDSATSFALTVINPVAVIGPMLSSDLGTSNLFVKKMLDGSTPGNPRIHIGFVDVRDVARAHVDSMTNTKTDGKRIILSRDEIWVSQLSEILRGLGHKAPKLNLPKWLLKIIAVFDKEVAGLVPLVGKVKDIDSKEFAASFDWQLRSIEESAKITADQLEAMGEI